MEVEIIEMDYCEISRYPENEQNIYN